jgi:integrase
LPGDTPGGGAGTSIQAEVARVISALEHGPETSGLRVANYRSEFELFATHLARVHSVNHLREVTPHQATVFITYPSFTADGVQPTSVRTQRTRRSNLRLLYRIARRLRLAESDPTLDVALPGPPGRSTRPLTDDEILVGRSFTLATLRETRIPTAWALAEATATSCEAGYVRRSDVDLTRGRIRIHGTNRRRARHVDLTDWGAEQIERRLGWLRARRSGDPPLLLRRDRGTPSDRRGSATDAITYALRRAGLSGDKGVRPGSIPAWRGARALANGSTVDEVARMLGVGTLDAAARIIGLNWRGGG